MALTAENDELTITMKFRGTAAAVTNALVNGLPREALVEIHAALETEMAKRAHNTEEEAHASER